MTFYCYTPNYPSHTTLQNLHHDRIGGTGDGVGLYAHNSLKPQISEKSVSSDITHVEFLLVKISFGPSPLFYTANHHPPQVPFGPIFEDSLYNSIPLYPNIIIYGHFNTTFLSSSPDKLDPENLFFSLHLHMI